MTYAMGYTRINCLLTSRVSAAKCGTRLYAESRMSRPQNIGIMEGRTC